MKKWLKIGLIVIGLIVLGLGLGLVILHESRPTGTAGPAAESMADQMLEAVNAEAWDSLSYIAWSFGGMHDFVWDREHEQVEVKWSGNRALLDLANGNDLVWRDQTALGGSDAMSLIQKAYHLFYNDSFWLQAFNKVRDPGTTREIAKDKDGREGLLVTYSSGGITPGDAYLWFLDENGLPISWKMWVQIIPVGGLEFSWEDWKVLPGGAKVALKHEGKFFGVPIESIKAGYELEDLNLEMDPFRTEP